MSPRGEKKQQREKPIDKSRTQKQGDDQNSSSTTTTTTSTSLPPPEGPSASQRGPVPSGPRLMPSARPFIPGSVWFFHPPLFLIEPLPPPPPPFLLHHHELNRGVNITGPGGRPQRGPPSPSPPPYPRYAGSGGVSITRPRLLTPPVLPPGQSTGISSVTISTPPLVDNVPPGVNLPTEEELYEAMIQIDTPEDNERKIEARQRICGDISSEDPDSGSSDA